MTVDLHMTTTTYQTRSGRILDADPVVIAIDQPARGRHDHRAEAKALVELIAEALPPETLAEVFACLAGELSERTSALAVIAAAVRGMEG